MDLKQKIEIQRLPENHEVSQSQIEQTKREAHEIFSKRPVEDFTNEIDGEVKQHTEMERTPGLASRIALNRLYADMPIVGPALENKSSGEPVVIENTSLQNSNTQSSNVKEKNITGKHQYGEPVSDDEYIEMVYGSVKAYEDEMAYQEKHDERQNLANEQSIAAETPNFRTKDAGFTEHKNKVIAEDVQATTQPTALHAKDINTEALAKDILKSELRDFFNQSYSASDESIIKVSTNFKFSNPHEWRTDEMERNVHATHITSDINLKNVEHACFRNMSNTHKREMNDSTSETRPALLAQHKVENSLFELQTMRFEVGNKHGKEVDKVAVMMAHEQTMNDFAEFKSLKTKLPIAEKLDMKSESAQVKTLEHKPKMEAPKEDFSHLWSQVKIKPIQQKSGLQMKMSQH